MNEARPPLLATINSSTSFPLCLCALLFVVPVHYIISTRATPPVWILEAWWLPDVHERGLYGSTRWQGDGNAEEPAS